MTAIRKAVTEQDYLDIYRFRYTVYVEEMKREQHYADHAEKIIREPLDENADLFGIWNNGDCVGTVRMNFSDRSDLGYYPDLYSMNMVGDYHPNHTCITTKLMIAKPYRKLGLVIALGKALYHHARSRGKEFDFIDANDYLLPYYNALGYRRYTDDITHPEYGKVTPLVLVGSDYDYLARIGSPWTALLKNYPQNREAVHFAYGNLDLRPANGS